MNKENIVDFTSINVNLIFNIMEFSGEYYEQQIPVSAAEDIEYNMKLFFNKKWFDLFENKDVTDVEFCGIRIGGKNQELDVWTGFEIHNRTYGRVRVNPDKISDKNGVKLQEIRRILC